MNSYKREVYVYGDINIDIVIPGTDSFPKPGQEEIVERMDTFIGGGAALFALGLGKLGVGTVFHGSVGKDFYGDFIKDRMEQLSIDTSMLNRSERFQTGISLSFTNESDRSFLTYRGTYEEMDLSHIDTEAAKSCGHVHITGYTAKRHEEYAALLKTLKKEGNVTISFDVGWDDSGEWSEQIKTLFPYLDIVFMNETEALHYTRENEAEAALLQLAKGAALVVLKLGSKGAVACQDNNICYANPFPVKAVDTTGAGDSFNAGFVYGFLRKKPVQEALAYANACGALSVTAYGGNTGFPTKEQLMAFLLKAKEEGGI